MTRCRHKSTFTDAFSKMRCIFCLRVVVEATAREALPALPPNKEAE